MEMNPILSEIQGLSPAAKAALGMAGHTVPPPVQPVQASPTGPVANFRLIQSAENAPPPASSPIKMPGEGVPSLISNTGGPVTPPAIVAPRGTTTGDTNERGRLLSTGSGVSQIGSKIENTGFGQAHPFLGKLLGGTAEGLGTLGDVGLSMVSPAAATVLPGTSYHHQMLLNQANRAVTQDVANDQKEAQTAQEKAQAGNLEAQTELHQQQAQNAQPVDVTPEMAEAAGIPELAGTKVSQATYQKFFSGTQKAGTEKDVAAGHDTTKVTTTGMNNTTSLTNNTNSNKTHESIADAANKTRTLIAQMHDATSRANNENTVSHSGTTSAGGYKIPADVTKRAALAANVTENADAVDALLKQHPDIVGARGGRYTNVQQMIGSDDPDIAELGVRIHNIALASNGAHGVRSQQAIAETEDNLFNHFHSGPTSIHGALQATRGSMQTFLDDEKNFGETGTRTAKASPGGPKVGEVRPGNDGSYRFKGGDQYDQKNWEKVK